MIVLDTSAMLAILLREPAAGELANRLAMSGDVLISAGTLSEMYIVASRRGIFERLDELLARIKPEIVPVTEEVAQQIGAIYRQWGKGFHPAGLNFGDCFAYALAKDRDLPLLFVGNDFARTDIRPAIGVA